VTAGGVYRIGALSRRALLAVAMVHLSGLPALGQSNNRRQRIVTFDWALTATALTLGANVVGLPSIDYYRITTVEPPVPAGVVDVGLLFTPNFEILDELAPDIIVIPSALNYTAGSLQRIAPTIVVDLYRGDPDPIRAAVSATVQLAEKLDLKEAAAALVARTDQTLAASKEATKGWQDKPFFVGTFADERHLTIFGAGSLYDAVLKRLSLRNAAEGKSMLNGRAVVGIEELSRRPDAAILLFPQGGNNAVPANSAAGIFWQSLPAVRDERVFWLSPTLEDGGLPATIRFARLVAAALPKDPDHASL